MSFTYLHWRLIEKIKANEIKIDEVDDEIVKMISFNILPMGKTFLHELVGQTANVEKFY